MYSNDIIMSVISEGGLTRRDYGFSYDGGKIQRLVYISFSEYNRDDVNEKWADEWETPLSYDKYLEKYDLDDSDYAYDKYDEYRKSVNPCYIRTKSGKSKYYGEMGPGMVACPDSVRDSVLEAFLTKIKMEVKVIC